MQTNQTIAIKENQYRMFENIDNIFLSAFAVVGKKDDPYQWIGTLNRGGALNQYENVDRTVKEAQKGAVLTDYGVQKLVAALEKASSASGGTPAYFTQTKKN